MPAVGTVVLAAAVLGGVRCISPMKVAMSNTTEPAYRGAGKGVSTLSESSVQGFKTGNLTLFPDIPPIFLLSFTDTSPLYM